MQGRSSIAIAVAVWGVIASHGAAQTRNERAQVGYELALFGQLVADFGGDLKVSGVAHEVRGLADLRPMPRATVEATVTRARTVRGRSTRETVRRADVTADADGRFDLALSIPDEPMPSPTLTLTIRRGADVGRTWDFPVQIRSALRLDLLADRSLYEPGETIHAWARLTERDSRRPIGDRRARIQIFDPSGNAIADRAVMVSGAGVASLDVEIPESATDGAWRIAAEVPGRASTASAAFAFRVGRRTVERLLVDAVLDQTVVPPAGRLRGVVTVSTPSGSPVMNARVELRPNPNADPVVVRTRADGQARFDVPAPAYLSGDVAPMTLGVRVTHPAHGALHSAAAYLLSRVEFRVAAVAGSGALVPEVDDRAYVHVTDARGDPAPEGTGVLVTGPAVRAGSFEGTLDAHGLVAVPMRVRAGAAAPISSTDANCDGSEATVVEVTVRAATESFARACVPVASEAQVLVLPRDAVIPPGGELAVEVRRRPEVGRRPVLLEAVLEGRALAWTWLGPNAREGVVTLPRTLTGVVEVRARAAHPLAGRSELNEDGATALGTGSRAAVLVRPPDAFTLEIDPGRDPYRVRERATIGLRTTPTGTARGGYVALVARDLAAHGGEMPWSLDWIGGALDRATVDPSAEGADLLLRSALAAGVNRDPEAVGPPPLTPEPWRLPRYDPGGASRGLLRDPLAARDELLRRGIGRVMVRLERVVAGLGPDATDRRGVLRRSGNRWDFDPDVLDNLVERRTISDSEALTLGGERLTVAMLRAADPSFDFDAVARRIARGRLMRLMVALAGFADPDDPHAARASAGEPPRRWLSRMVQLGMLPADAMVDPWGAPFVFREVGAGRPALVVSARAAGWELVSAGPDGRAGTADDVRNPFARVITRGTPYAVASGEDALLERLSLLAPGGRVLGAMVRAFETLGLAARDESRAGPVTATGSEQAAPLEPSVGLGNIELNGGGGGAGGEGYGRGAGRPSRTRAPNFDAADEAMPVTEEERDDDGRRERLAQAQAPPPPPAPPSSSRLAVMGELVRERFPATLHFVGEARLDPGGLTTMELPLADALTTYRIEAIGWTSSGWTTTGSGELRVDQDATVDAPVPTHAVVGDVLRIPIRVANRTTEPLPVRVEITAEDVGLDAPRPRALEVPPRDAVETVVEVTVSGRPGTGAVVVRAVRASDGAALDAVRRPLTVVPDARLVREALEVLVGAGSSLEVDVPESASPRGPGELRLAVGDAIFGDPATFDRTIEAAWAFVLAGRPAPPDGREWARTVLTAGDAEDELGLDPLRAAAAVSIAWDDRGVSDDYARRGLRAVSRVLEDLEGIPLADRSPEMMAGYADVLLALAPPTRRRGRPGAARRDLRRLVERLRREVGDAGARAADAPVEWARSAAALALARGDDDGARARELARRASREVIRVADEAWLEPEASAGIAAARVAPTALLALARIGLDARVDALPLVRNLASIARGRDGWDSWSRALASAAAMMLTTGPVERVRVEVDGRPARVRRVGDAIVATLPGLGTPGRHRIDVTMPEGALALASLSLRYGMPWDAEPPRRASLALGIEGAVGARDTRAGLLLTVQNRGPRVLVEPVVEVDLPAGVELDEPTREALEAMTRGRPTREGRTLRIELRPLAPGGRAQIPLPIRWSLAGRLRGLGVAAFDDAFPRSVAGRPTRVLPARVVEVPDEGDEPEIPEPDISAPPEPPPPDPIPLPEPLDPVAANVARLGGQS